LASFTALIYVKLADDKICMTGPWAAGFAQ